MRAVPGLAAGDLHAGLPVGGEHRLAERLGAVGVGPLPHHQHRGVLGERHRVVDRGDAGLVPRLARGGGGAVQPLGQHPDVLRGGAAAAADQRHAVLGDEPLQRVGQLHRGQREVRPVGGQHRQAGVRHHRQRDAGVLGQVAQVLAHLGRAGGAVQADQVDPERLDRGQRRADLAAQQHGAGGLHGDVADDRHRLARLGHRPLRPDHRRLDLEQVLAGLDDQRVRAAGDQAGGVLLVRVAQRARTRRARGWAAWCPARSSRARTGAAPGCSSASAASRAIRAPASDSSRIRCGMSYSARLAQVGAEGVGLHAVRAGGQVGVVHSAHHVRPGDVEDLVAPLQPLEVVEGQVGGLQHRPHRPVGDEDPVGQHIQQRSPHGSRLVRPLRHRSRPRRSHILSAGSPRPVRRRAAGRRADRRGRRAASRPARRLTDVKDNRDATVPGGRTTGRGPAPAATSRVR